MVECLVQCSESLQLPATNLLEPGMEMVTNSQGSQVTIEGDNVKNINQLVRMVAYLNRQFEFEKIVEDICKYVNMYSFD